MNTNTKETPHPGVQRPVFSYPRCSKEGHKNLELKFIEKKELNNVKNVYCLACMQKLLSGDNNKLPELPIILDDVIDEVVSLSTQYKDQLEPIIDAFYRKHQEISENDFRNMFEELTIRSEDFKKTLDNFQGNIAILCSNFERLFQKRLEAIFYESLIEIDAELSSSKKTFEILRLKIRSYSENLASYFSPDQELSKYCENINTILKDFNALKTSNLPHHMVNLINKAPGASQVVEKFRTSCSFDTEILHMTDGIIACLTQKFKNMQDDLNVAILKLNQGYKGARPNQPDSNPSNKQQQQQHEPDIATDSTQPNSYKRQEEHSPKNKESLTQPLLENCQMEDWSGKAEEAAEWQEEQFDLVDKIAFPEAEGLDDAFSSDEEDKIREESPDGLEDDEIKKSSSPGKSHAEECSEQLKKFAASLILKAERKTKGEDFQIEEDEQAQLDELKKQLSGLSGLKDLEKKEKKRVSSDHLRVSKKITKSRRLTKHKEKESEPKIGKYIDIQKKMYIKDKSLRKDTWGDLKLYSDMEKEQIINQLAEQGEAMNKAQEMGQIEKK